MHREGLKDCGWVLERSFSRKYFNLFNAKRDYNRF